MLESVSRRRQRGLTLVGLMIGMVLGLFVVACAAALLVTRIREHRALLIESRLMQDLRTSADLITRDLRRAGYWGDATAAIARTGTGGAIANPYVAVAPGAAASDAVSLAYSRDAVENQVVDNNEQFGFQLHQGVIRMQLGHGNWQALTDADTMRVTTFSITPEVQQIPLQDFCDKPCPPGAANCPPRQQVRSFAVVITGRATADSSVVRSVRSQARLRNDRIVGACPP
jgi:type IV pilus assembly protein PilW